MKFSREQFDSLGDFHIEDFPINQDDKDLMFEIFNHLEKHEQGMAISWGVDDTVFNDNVFKYLCQTQLGMSVEEYYQSQIAKDYFDNGKLIDIDFSKFI